MQAVRRNASFLFSQKRLSPATLAASFLGAGDRLELRCARTDVRDKGAKSRDKGTDNRGKVTESRDEGTRSPSGVRFGMTDQADTVQKYVHFKMQQVHICAGTGARPCPHLHQDWARPLPTFSGAGLTPAQMCTV